MSVYTQLTRRDFTDLLSLYDQGELLNWQGIEAGIENTNYFVDSHHPSKGDQQFVLTIFEAVPKDRLPFYLQFMTHLAHSGLPVPAPIVGRDGQILRQIKGKPAILQPRLPGHHLVSSAITNDHRRMIGEQLAHIHLAGQSASFSQNNHRGMGWIGEQVTRLAPLLSQPDADLLTQQWTVIQQALAQQPNLPRGLIHADLFIDNVLFCDGAVSGIIDFFQSCDGWLLYDVAVTVNDWCLRDDGLALNDQAVKVLLNAYHSIRPFTEAERRLWPIMNQLACLRFWISRIVTYIHPEQTVAQPDDASDVLRQFKDPDQFRDRLLLRIQHASALTLPNPC